MVSWFLNIRDTLVEQKSQAILVLVVDGGNITELARWANSVSNWQCLSVVCHVCVVCAIACNLNLKVFFNPPVSLGMVTSVSPPLLTTHTHNPLLLLTYPPLFIVFFHSLSQLKNKFHSFSLLFTVFQTKKKN